MPFFYGADALTDFASEPMRGTRDARTLEVGGRLAQAFRDGGLDTQVGTKRAGFKTGDIPMPASDRFANINDSIPLKRRSQIAATTKDKKLSERLKTIMGFALTDAAGTTYTVATTMGAVSIKRTAKDGSVLGTLLPGAPEYARTALMLLNASKSRSIFKGKPKGMFKPSASSGSSSGGGEGTGDQSGQSGDQSGSQTPSWASQPYIAEMLALAGFTGPNFQAPATTFTVKKVELDGFEAPAVDGSYMSDTGPMTTTSTPKDENWVTIALLVLESKSKTDAGLTPSTSSTPGTLTVTTEMTGSEGSVWTSEGVPSSDDALAQQAQATIDAAVAEAGAGGGAMTVSADGAAASGESMLGKYKWPLILGIGVVGLWYGNKQGWFK